MQEHGVLERVLLIYDEAVHRIECVRRPMAIAQNAGWRSHKTRHRDRTKRRIAITLRG